ncbi:MAG: hypothetical protein K0R25_1295 [Rickettsiaceae bacterium]|jgi:hypothetical protein|nr:hypothetical protein [Rickettsiaceae bacterium]
MLVLSFGESIIILAILFLNLANIFWFKASLTRTLCALLTGLAVILLCATSVSKHQILQGLIIATTIYFAINLAVIFNIHGNQITDIKKSSLKKFFVYAMVFTAVLLVSCGIFCLAKDDINYSKQDEINYLRQIVTHETDTPQAIPEADKQTKLENNIMLKNSTEIILTIVAATTIALLIKKRRHSDQ